MGREELIIDVAERINNMRRITTLLKSKQCVQLFDTSPTHLIERATKYAREGDVDKFKEWLESHPNKTITIMGKKELRERCKQARVDEYWNLSVGEMRSALLQDKVRVRDGFIAVNTAITEGQKAECVPFLVEQINNVLDIDVLGTKLGYKLVCNEVVRETETFMWAKKLWSVCNAYSKLYKSRDLAYWNRCHDNDDEVVALNRRRSEIKKSTTVSRLPEGIERYKDAKESDKARTSESD